MPCRINGHTFLAFDFTRRRYDAFQRLGAALSVSCRTSRRVPAVVARGPALGHAAAAGLVGLFAFSGYIGHYHLTNQKWDPGPFDFKKFCSKLRGSFCFPLFPRGEPKKDQDRR